MKCKLNVILAERRIKKTEFAKQVGINPGTLTSWLNDKSIPKLDDAYRVSKALDLKVEDIWILEE